MMNQYLSIGGNTIKVLGSDEVGTLMSIPGFATFAIPQENAEAKGIISFGEDLEAPTESELLYDFEFEANHAHCEFRRNGNTYWYIMSREEGAPFLMNYQRGETIVHASHSNIVEEIRFGCWFAFALLSASWHCTLIHSSTIVNDGKAILFLGESGTGKSTHTRLWLQHIEGSRLLNDDSPVLFIRDGIPYVSGSPWSGKTACFHQATFPLGGVVRLSQAKENRIRKLHTIEGFTALQPSCPPALAYDEVFSDDIVKIISAVIQKVPVFHLECLPDKAAAEMSHDAIFSHE